LEWELVKRPPIGAVLLIGFIEYLFGALLFCALTVLLRAEPVLLKWPFVHRRGKVLFRRRVVFWPFVFRRWPFVFWEF